MIVIVKFKDEPFPTFMQIYNSGYVHDLSTMARVEWVSAGYFDQSGSFHGRKANSRDSQLGDVIIRAYLPGDPRAM